MFGFLNRNRSKKTRYADRFLSAGEMERLLIKERIRCDRYHQFFSLIIVQFHQESDGSRSTHERALARYLSSKLRVIDDFGLLRNGGLGILLPMTNIEGGRVVLDKVLHFAKQHDLNIQGDVFAYYGRFAESGDSPKDDYDDPFNEQNNQLFENTDEPKEERSRLFRDYWRAEGKPESLFQDDVNGSSTLPNLFTPSAEAITTEIAQKAVRADLETQSPVRSPAELLSLCSKTYPLWKRQIDIVGASIGLLASLPILVVAGVSIKLTSSGPVFFKQSRCGQFGRPFLIYKLRTMSNNAEQTKHLLEDLNERDGPAFKIQNDPRVTPIGKFLRATGIDELPQLINVLKGEMALVGPRPLPVAEDEKCSTWQQRRLDTKPGITCLWQISKSRKMTFDEWMRLDLHYLKKRSLRYDVSLVLRTVKAVFLGRVGH
jgi:lipopolysaccharide/colanic/teichoic acid biosynthesis glycosyltransferase